MKKLVKIVLKSLMIFVVLFTIPNYYSQMYRFTSPGSFKGDEFYNPYEILDGQWIKCNFHAHTKAFAGLAKGKNNAVELLGKYKRLGYDVASVSNYNFVQDSTPGSHYFPAYEHGFNPGWVHQLVMNGTSPQWFDYPLFQLRGNKQFIIDRLKTDENLIVLNHSSFKNAYRLSDLKYLGNYDLIEGVSEFSSSIKQWDMALTHGHPVWVTGNDDAHDTSDYHVGVCWNMVLVDRIANHSIVNSLKKGAAYATKGWLGQEMNRIEKLSVERGVYKLKLKSKADSVILCADQGQRVAFNTNSDTIEYQIAPENTYVRAEIYETEAWNTYTRMYLNPVIRVHHKNVLPQAHQNKISYGYTLVYVLSLLVFHLITLRAIWKW